jgi:hypothetical protein
MSAPDDLDLRLALTEALDRIDALETEVRELRSPAPPAAPTTVSPIDPPDIATPATVDRRRLLGKAGAAAVGAMLGGAVAAVSTAGPAAAATGSFDSSTSDPALTAISTGSGAAIKATSTGSGDALTVSGRSTIRTATGTALDVEVQDPNQGVGLWVQETSTAAVLQGIDHGLWAMGDLAISATGESLGLVAAGRTAQLLLAEEATYYSMAPPLTRSDAHERGEIYFDSNSDLWLCVVSGTPGSWAWLGGASPDPDPGPASSGTFTVLHRPVRVYTATAVTGIIHGIDLTTASSGVPTDATAAVITVNITNTTAQANSFCKVFADDLTTPPPTTAVRWRDAKELIANSVTTRLAATKIATQINGQANLAIDVVGYYR